VAQIVVLFGGPGNNRCENIPYDSVVVFRFMSDDFTQDVLSGKLQARSNDGLVRVDENGTHFIYNVTVDQTLSLYHRVIWMNGDSVIRTDYVKHGYAPTAPEVGGLIAWKKAGQQADIGNERITTYTTYVAVGSHHGGSGGGGSDVQETEIVNPDGSVTRITDVTTMRKDGTSSERIVETTTKDGEPIRERTVVKEKDIQGATTVTFTETEYTDSGRITTSGKTFPDGNTIEAEWSGEYEYEEMSGRIVIECHQGLTKEQDKYVCNLIGKAIGQKINPEVVIVTDSAVGVSDTIVGMIIFGNGSLTFIENGNDLHFTAKALAGLGDSGIDKISITLTHDLPEGTDPRIDSAYDITITIDGQEYHGPYEESLKVTVPFQLDVGKDPSKIAVYYIGDGLERIASSYQDGHVTFGIEHTSLYAVVYSEEVSPIAPSVSFDPLTILAIVLIAVVIGAVVLVAVKRKA